MRTKNTNRQNIQRVIEREAAAELKANVEKLAKGQSKTELEIITALQAAAVVTSDEALLEMLCELKWNYIQV